MKLFYKLGIIAVLISVGVLYYLHQWRAPHMRRELQLSSAKLYEYIKDYPQSKRLTIQSMNHSFDVSYIENMPLESLNPYFPTIYITNNDCHAWLHLVRTDAKFQTEYQCFIDAGQKLYPLYSDGTIFVDQPSWGYDFFTKPLSFWKGHVWAIQLNHKDKTIKCLGGISWGYRLPQFSFKPSMILPEPLAKQDWQKDWEEMYKPVFKDYRDIT